MQSIRYLGVPELQAGTSSSHYIQQILIQFSSYGGKIQASYRATKGVIEAGYHIDWKTLKSINIVDLFLEEMLLLFRS